MENRKKLPKGLYWRGKIIWITYQDGSGNQVRESTGSQSMGNAKAILYKKKTEIREGKNPILKKRNKIKFDDFATEYLKECEGKKSYLFTSQMIDQLKKYFGKYSLDEITLSLIKQYKAKRQNEKARNRNKKPSPATVNRELAVLRNALNIAVENERLKFSPLVRQSKLFAKEFEKQRIFTGEEISAMITAASQPMRWFVILAVNTGMREGEIMGLCWNEIDLKNRVITLTAIRTKGNRTRAVFMNDTVFQLLSERKLQRGENEKGGEYVFPNPDTGKPFKWISHSWAKLLIECKINPPGRFHDLRHTFATKAAENGVPQVTLRDILGHRYSTTTDRYMTGTDKSKRDAAARVQFGIPAGEIIELKEAK